MMASQRKRKRFLAVLLSASFLWAAMACVSLCLLHGSEEESCATEPAETSGEVAAAAGEALQAGEAICANSASCCQPECCPMKPLPACALQKSASGDYQFPGDAQIATIHTALPGGATWLNRAQRLLPHSTSDPPFARLRTLRI